MPEPLDDAGIERLLLETRALVDTLRTDRRMPDGPVAEGRGTASEDQIEATVRDGRVASIRLEPRLLRRPPEEFAALVRDAVNAAIDDLRGGASAGAPVPDPVALSETLREVQNEALRQMTLISDGIAGAMARIREQTRISGDPSPQGLEHLLQLTQRNLDDVAAAKVDTDDHRGEGESARGQIRAVAVIGRLESVTVDKRAMRMPSHELAEQLQVAINAALEELRSSVRDRRQASALDSGELTERVREVQDMSLAHMQTYTRALRDIMGSIEGPE